MHPHRRRRGPQRGRHLFGVDSAAAGRRGQRTPGGGPRRQPVQNLPTHQGRGVATASRRGTGGRRRQLHRAAGTHPGHRRRIGFGQVDHAEPDSRTDRTGGGFHRDSGRERRPLGPSRPPRAEIRTAGGVPGPGGVAGPPAAGVRRHRRTPGRERIRPPPLRGAGRRAAGHRRPRPRRRRPLSRRVLRRAEAANRDRPRAGVAAEDPRARRAGVGAGCVNSGGHHQPAAGPAAAVRVDLSVRVA